MRRNKARRRAAGLLYVQPSSDAANTGYKIVQTKTMAPRFAHLTSPCQQGCTLREIATKACPHSCCCCLCLCLLVHTNKTEGLGQKIPRLASRAAERLFSTSACHPAHFAVACTDALLRVLRLHSSMHHCTGSTGLALGRPRCCNYTAASDFQPPASLCSA